MEFLNKEYLGNPVVHYLAVAAIILISILIGRIIKHVLLKTAKKSEEKDRPISATFFKAFSDSIVFIAFAVGQNFGLDLTAFPPGIEKFQEVTSDVILVLAITKLAWSMILVPEAWVQNIAAKDNSSLSSMVGPMVRNSLRTVVILLSMLQCIQIVSNQDFATILAGLGVGAVALALAAQQSVSNFFGSVVLFVNKPFDIGDRIVYSGNDGTVEQVGIMCTKQRTLDGHLVTIPNGKLSGDVIRNIAKRPNIKQTHNITITYDTPPEKIKQAVKILRELLDNHEGMNEDFPPRVYFNALNADSLNILVIYWYHPPAYWDFLEFNQQFLQTAFERFAEADIEFAFPTQTVYLAGDENRPLEIGIRRDEANT